jgi:hypothetical protein
MFWLYYYCDVCGTLSWELKPIIAARITLLTKRGDTNMEYNRNRIHQGGTKAFKDLTFKEQALSINGTVANLEKAIRHHVRNGGSKKKQTERRILEKCIGQVERLASRLRRAHVASAK